MTAREIAEQYVPPDLPPDGYGWLINLAVSVAEDAYKAGMLRAAEITLNHACEDDCGMAGCMARRAAAHDIRAEAEKETPDAE